MLAAEILDWALHTDRTLAAESLSCHFLEATRNEVWMMSSSESEALMWIYDHRWHGY